MMDYQSIQNLAEQNEENHLVFYRWIKYVLLGIGGCVIVAQISFGTKF